MQGPIGDRMNGLIDGISSRYLRANRSELLPSLARLKHNHTERTLHGRLEELLCFEIMKDGATDYHRFTVRTLHKYVMNAIKNPNSLDSPRAGEHSGNSNLNVVNHLASHSVVNGDSLDDWAESAQQNQAAGGTSVPGNLGTIDETRPCDNPDDSKTRSEREKESGHVPCTYRERLGGFLHPRDMRRLVTPFSASNEPGLIVRRHTILLNFDPLRAIVLRDRLIVLVPDGADSILVELEKRVLGCSDFGSEGIGNTVSKSESTASMDDIMNVSSPSTTNEATKLDPTLDKKEEQSGNYGEQSKDDNLSDKSSGTARTDFMVDGADHSSEQPALTVDVNEQEYIAAFADEEWKELEGNWIDLPFELQCADSVLHSVSAILADDVLDLQLAANSVISDMLLPGADVGDHTQDVLRNLKLFINEINHRVDGFCRALDTLLEDYEDMALMNLSRLLTHPDRFVQPVPQAVLDEESDEPELILEAHLQHGHTLKNALTLIQGQIISAEDFAARKSDSIRNRLLYINMLISILSLSVAVGSFVGSVFGMNVINSYEDSQNAFRVIVFSTIGGSIFFVGLVLFTIRKLGALPNLF